jgi:hypothetical protein
MRRLRFTLTLCALALAIGPSHANAQLLEWLDELSGPGYFFGYAFEWRLVCFSEPDPMFKGAQPTTDEHRLAAARYLAFLGSGCFFKQVPVDHRRILSINLKFALLDAKDNDLQYEFVSEADRDVKLTTLLPTVSWRPVRSVEAAFGVGVYWFSGPAFESFHRLFVQPIQVDLKPLALINDLRQADSAWWDELFAVRASVNIVPRGFDATDFGAIPGTFRVSRDTLPSVALFIDLESVVMHLRRVPAKKSP